MDHFAYTVATDLPGSGGYRMLAKLLGCSLARTQFSGEFVIFRTTPEPIFNVERKGISEIYVDCGPVADWKAAEELGWGLKYRVRDKVRELVDAEPGRFDKVVFLDADCLALRNIDFLLDGDWDISYFPERKRGIQDPFFNGFLTEEEMRTLRIDGINSGTLAVRATRYHEVMAEWERIDRSVPVREKKGDQPAWNRLVLDTKLKAKKFERDTIQCPLHLNPKWQDYMDASLVHTLGGNLREKLQFTFGLYMSRFFHDDSSAFFNLLEM